MAGLAIFGGAAVEEYNNQENIKGQLGIQRGQLRAANDKAQKDQLEAQRKNIQSLMDKNKKIAMARAKNLSAQADKLDLQGDKEQAQKLRASIPEALEPLKKQLLQMSEMSSQLSLDVDTPEMIEAEFLNAINTISPNDQALFDANATKQKEQSKADVQRQVPDLVTMKMSGGEFQTFDKNSEAELIKQARQAGAVEVPLSLQASEAGGIPGLEDKEAVKFRENLIATRGVLAETTRMREQLASGMTFTGILGSTVTGFASLAGNVNQALKANNMLDGNPLEQDNYDMTSFGSAAASSAAFRSNIKNLAFLMARAADPGGRLSDRDVQIQIDRMSGNSGDQGQIIASLDEIDRAVKTNIKIQHQTLSDFGNVGEFPSDLEITKTEGVDLTPREKTLLNKRPTEITDEEFRGLSFEAKELYFKKYRQ